MERKKHIPNIDFCNNVVDSFSLVPVAFVVVGYRDGGGGGGGFGGEVQRNGKDRPRRSAPHSIRSYY